MYFAGDYCKIDMYYVVGRRIKVWVLCRVDKGGKFFGCVLDESDVMDV